jgi:hypothetical protein
MNKLDASQILNAGFERSRAFLSLANIGCGSLGGAMARRIRKILRFDAP